VRHNPSTVVVLAGQASDGLLAAVSRLMNVSLVRPAQTEGAASALRRAAGISRPMLWSPPTHWRPVAAEWQAMWEISDAPRGSEAFELRAAEAVASWRAGQFETARLLPRARSPVSQGAPTAAEPARRFLPGAAARAAPAPGSGRGGKRDRRAGRRRAHRPSDRCPTAAGGRRCPRSSTRHGTSTLVPFPLSRTEPPSPSPLTGIRNRAGSGLAESGLLTGPRTGDHGTHRRPAQACRAERVLRRLAAARAPGRTR